MDWLRLLLRLSVRRARSSRGLLFLVAAVVFVAVTLVATSAIYSQTLAEAGLRHTLSSVGQTSLQMRIIVRDRPLGEADYLRLRDAVEPSVAQRIGWLEDKQDRYGRTQSIPLGLYKDDDKVEAIGDLGLLFFQTGFRDKVRLVEGYWPEVAPSQEEGEPFTLEVLVGTDVARRMDWEIGSAALLFPYGTGSEARARVKIAGIVEPEDPGELYWLGNLSHFDIMADGTNPLVPFFIPEETYFNSLGAMYPTLMGTYWWFVFLRMDELTASLVDEAQQGVTLLETDINKLLPRSLVLTGLAPSLRSFEQRLELSRVSLLLLMSLVVGVLLFFLAMVMNLLVRSRHKEMALFRGRGAGALSTAALLTMGEGVAMVAISVALGPLLAWAVVRAFLVKSLNPTGVEDLGILVNLSSEVYVLAACVGVVALVILFLVGLYSARLHLADFLKERARPPGVPLVHRYYLDALVLLMFGVLLWQVHARGGFVSEKLLGGLQVDPVLLVGPVVALLAAGLVLLRALPLVLRTLSVVSERICPIWVSFFLKRMARDPVVYGLLTTILLAAAAMGTFASTFHPTLLRSQYDQAYYSVASDIVIEEPMGRSGSLERMEGLESVPGTEAVTAVYRGEVRLAKEGEEPKVPILAVTPETLAQTVWFRQDFSDKSVVDLADLLSDRPRGQEAELWLPAEAESLGVWVQLQDYSSIYVWKPKLWARVMDSRGNYEQILLGEMPFRYEWHYLETELPDPSGYMEPPFRLVAVYLGVTDMANPNSGIMNLDDITVKGAALPPSGVVVEGFEERRPWTFLPGRNDEETVVIWEGEAAHTGDNGLRFSWREHLGVSPTGITMTSVQGGLDAIGGASFVRGEQLLLHTHNTFMPVTVRGIAHHFPTLDPGEGGFLIVNLVDYDNYLREQPGHLRVEPNEYWVSREEGASPGEVLSSLREEVAVGSAMTDRNRIVGEVMRDPLKVGGWGDVTVIAVLVLAGVVLLSLITYGTLFFERARVDLAVARTFGLSRSHVMFGIFAERILLVVLGVVAGWGVGLGLSKWVLGYLAITPTGGPVMPPMLTVWSTGLLLSVFGSILGAILVSLVFSVTQVFSHRVAPALRLEE
jgi:ABC-type lipoprotein release transport system permease subunit